MSDLRPFRSVLYIPGSKPRALDKARSLPVDAILFDLEDAVSPDEKAAARTTLTKELAAGGYGPLRRSVSPRAAWLAGATRVIAQRISRP